MSGACPNNVRSPICIQWKKWWSYVVEPTFSYTYSCASLSLFFISSLSTFFFFFSFTITYSKWYTNVCHFGSFGICLFVFFFFSPQLFCLTWTSQSGSSQIIIKWKENLSWGWICSDKLYTLLSLQAFQRYCNACCRIFVRHWSLSVVLAKIPVKYATKFKNGCYHQSYFWLIFFVCKWLVRLLSFKSSQRWK